MRKCRLSFLQELVGRNNLLKLLSPHPLTGFYCSGLFIVYLRFSEEKKITSFQDMHIIILLGFMKKKEHCLLIKIVIGRLYLKQ